MKPSSAMLIGSTFPLSLVRRAVRIVPAKVEELRVELRKRAVISFWGHKNTLSAAGEVLGVDLTPKFERPAIDLTEEKLPQLDGQAFTEAWIVSPDYMPGYRPAIGEEVQVDKIRGWQVLRVKWE
jgi:hypothetical protein